MPGKARNDSTVVLIDAVRAECIKAALLAYDEQAAPAEIELLAQEMAPFVAMVREHLPRTDGRSADQAPRWSGY